MLEQHTQFPALLVRNRLNVGVLLLPKAFGAFALTIGTQIITPLLIT